MQPPRLLTERLVLREFRPEDVGTGVASAQDPEVQRFLGGPKDAYEAFTGLATHAGHWAIRGYGSWIVERREDGAPLGRVGLWHPETWPGVEVGWRLYRSSWGQGYATEAARAAIGWAWTARGFDELISLIVPDNVASQRVARRLGHINRGRVEIPVFGTTDRWVLARPPGDDAYNFRAATPGDAPRLNAFIAEAMARYRDISPPGWTPRVPPLEAEREALEATDARSVLCEPGGVLAGVVSWRPAAMSRLQSSDPGLVHFGRLFVDPGWWGTGLAERLHAMAIDDARARGFRTLVLFTPAGQGRARRFYERLGWRQVRVVDPDPLFGMPTVEYTYTI
jgi:RimJ/RimL family protein N-acetyltransferase